MEVTIDCRDGMTAIHGQLAQALTFPAWYGNNLDALHDCLTDIREDAVIRFVDFDDLEEHLPIYGRLTVRVVRHACSTSGSHWSDPAVQRSDVG